MLKYFLYCLVFYKIKERCTGNEKLFKIISLFDSVFCYLNFNSNGIYAMGNLSGIQTEKTN